MIQLLLVDDEPVILKSLVNNDWHSAGISSVYEADNGLTAVELLKQQAVDIVVTDIRMPGMDGLQLCRHIGEHYPHTQCILLSGYGEFEYAKKAIQYGVSSYLLKPVKDEDLLEEVGRLAAGIRKDEEQRYSQAKAQQTLHIHLPLLKSNLLNDLLAGVVPAGPRLTEQLEQYGLPFTAESPCSLLLVRMEGVLRQSGDKDLPLYEYAVQNIACEILERQFEVWFCKDRYGYFVFVLQPKETGVDPGGGTDVSVEAAARQVQVKISRYLKGAVSVLVSPSVVFPAELGGEYHKSLNEFRKVPRSDGGSFIRSGESRSQSQSLQSLHSPPGFQQLLEAGRYDEARRKLGEVFDEMDSQMLDTEEHLMELVYLLANTFLYMAHLQGKTLLELSGWEAGVTTDSRMFSQPDRVREWALAAIGKMESRSMRDLKDGKNQLIAKIHRFIEARIAEDVSLQTIADHVGLHPVYLSTVYKQEMKENISDFIIRYRMEKAAMLLRTTEIRIYELASRLGFQNPPYFSKLFKQYYGVTPQEYRDRLVN